MSIIGNANSIKNSSRGRESINEESTATQSIAIMKYVSSAMSFTSRAHLKSFSPRTPALASTAIAVIASRLQIDRQEVYGG